MCFRGFLVLQKNWVESTEFPYTAYLTPQPKHDFPCLLTFCISVVHLLQPMIQYWYIFIN